MQNIIIKGGSVIDVVAKKITKGDIFVKDGKISAAFPEGEAAEVIDAEGSYVSPGLIDGHIHIESSMLTPLEFARESVSRGTTSVFVDPHEITNVLGPKGIELFLEQADLVPFTMNVGIPSCVPATNMETAGGAVMPADIEKFINDPRVYGLAEMMNFPGIVMGFGDAREKVKIAVSAGKIVDGHAPGLSGEDLVKYITNGECDGKVRIGSDHECTTAAEAIEKSEKGMYIMLRHGSAAKDLENILPEVCRSGRDLRKFGLVSDDLSAADLRRRGHVDHLVKLAAGIIREIKGCGKEEAFIEALSMATVNHAAYFGKDTGKLAMGLAADVIIFDSFDEIKPSIVISRGRVVVRNGKYAGEKVKYDYSGYAHPVRIPEQPGYKIFAPRGMSGRVKARVIGVKVGTLLTEEIITDVLVINGALSAVLSPGVLKVAVIERHKGTENVSLGLVKGFSIKTGAIASTVAHDSHNLIVVGADDISMGRAAKALKRSGGGLAAISGKNEEILPLDLGGLMSTASADEVIKRHERLLCLTEEMGAEGDPFATLSFIALPVIPILKITDKGLVDVDKFHFVQLFCES